MKRNVKALAILSLFGLGLASVTSCGPQGPSITISVDGEEVENGGIATVSQGIDFKLTANIYGGAEGDTVRWSTNAASVFTFSSTTENEVTASANEATNQGYTVRATLASDSSITASITLMVNPSEMSYKIYVDTTDAQVNYGTGESFTSDGLVVGVQQYAGDTPTSNRFDLGEEEYYFQDEDGNIIQDGYVFREEGRFNISVVAADPEAGYESAAFTVTVEFDATYLVEEILDTFDRNGSNFTNIVYGLNDEQTELVALGYDTNVSIWGDYVLDQSTFAPYLYHETSNGIEKFGVDIKQDDNGTPNNKDDDTVDISLNKLEDQIYFTYEPLTDLSRLISLNSIPSHRDFSDSLVDALQPYQMDQQQGIYTFVVNGNSEVANTLVNMSGIAYDDLVYGLRLQNYDVSYETICVVQDGGIVFDVAALVPYGTSYSLVGERVMFFTPVDNTSPDSDFLMLEEMVADYEGEVAADPELFETSIQKIRDLNFDATYGTGLFSNLSAELHATPNYIANEVYVDEYNAQNELIGTTVVSNGIVTLPGGTITTETDEVEVGAGDYQFVHISPVTRDVDEETGLPTTTYERPLQFIQNPTENDYSSFRATDFSAAESNLNLSLIDGLLDYTNLEPHNEYWETEYEVTEQVDLDGDKVNESTITQGSFNFYGTGDNPLFAYFIAVLGEDYWNQFVEAAGLPNTLDQCKMNLVYNLTNNDWSHPNSFIRLSTYISDWSSEESAYVSMGAIDQMSIYNIGKGGSDLLDTFIASIVPTDAPTVSA